MHIAPIVEVLSINDRNFIYANLLHRSDAEVYCDHLVTIDSDVLFLFEKFPDVAFEPKVEIGNSTCYQYDIEHIILIEVKLCISLFYCIVLFFVILMLPGLFNFLVIRPTHDKY